MIRPAVRDRLAVALDDVLEAEAGAAQIDTAKVDRQAVVEASGPQVTNVGLGRRRLDSLLA